MPTRDRLPLVSILVVTWNRREEVMRSIRSAVAQTYPATEIVVVDNGSSDGTPDAVAEAFPGARLERLPENLGCPSGRNVGFTYCRGKYIFQLDDDGWLEPDAVERAVMRAETDERIAVVASEILESDERGRGRTRLGWTAPRFVFHFSGCASMLRRSALEAVGAYPDDFFRQGEEEDLALRLYDGGWTCVFEPSSVMHHRPSPRGRSPDLMLLRTLVNTNKTSLRLWPFPWCALRPFVSAAYAAKETLGRRYWALPGELTRELLRDLVALHRTRRPVSRSTYRLYRALQARPSPELTLQGRTYALAPLPPPADPRPDEEAPTDPGAGPVGERTAERR